MCTRQHVSLQDFLTYCQHFSVCMSALVQSMNIVTNKQTCLNIDKHLRCQKNVATIARFQFFIRKSDAQQSHSKDIATLPGKSMNFPFTAFTRFSDMLTFPSNFPSILIHSEFSDQHINFYIHFLNIFNTIFLGLNV